jgi:hypothetical protein
MSILAHAIRSRHAPSLRGEDGCWVPRISCRKLYFQLRWLLRMIHMHRYRQSLLLGSNYSPTMHHAKDHANTRRHAEMHSSIWSHMSHTIRLCCRIHQDNPPMDGHLLHIASLGLGPSRHCTGPANGVLMVLFSCMPSTCRNGCQGHLKASIPDVKEANGSTAPMQVCWSIKQRQEVPAYAEKLFASSVEA